MGARGRPIGGITTVSDRSTPYRSPCTTNASAWAARCCCCCRQVPCMQDLRPSNKKRRTMTCMQGGQKTWNDSLSIMRTSFLYLLSCTAELRTKQTFRSRHGSTKGAKYRQQPSNRTACRPETAIKSSCDQDAGNGQLVENIKLARQTVTSVRWLAKQRPFADATRHCRICGSLCPRGHAYLLHNSPSLATAHHDKHHCASIEGSPT